MKNLEGFILLEGDPSKIDKSVSFLKQHEIMFVTANNRRDEVVVKVNMEKTRFEAWWDVNVKNGLLKKSVIKGL